MPNQTQTLILHSVMEYPKSAEMISKETGIRVQSIYRHVKKLIDLDLLEKVGRSLDIKGNRHSMYFSKVTMDLKPRNIPEEFDSFYMHRERERVPKLKRRATA